MKSKQRLLLIFIFFIISFFLIILFNYYAPSSRFNRLLTADQQIEALKSGKYLKTKAPERILIQRYLQLEGQNIDIMAFGSSRSLAINSNALKSNRFLNISASFGSLFDLVAIVALFEEQNAYPQSLIISLDGWMLNANNAAKEWLEYGEYVNKGLKILDLESDFSKYKFGYYEKIEHTFDNLNYLISLPVFQNNLMELAKRIFLEKSFIRPFRTTLDYYSPDEIHDKSELWERDLSYWYPCHSPTRVTEEARKWGTEKARDGDKKLHYNFHSIDQNLIRLLKKILDKLKEKDVKVSFFFPPFHPETFSHMDISRERQLTLQAGKIYKAIAQQRHIAILGDYNPALVNLKEADFCSDAIHLRPDIITRLFQENNWEGIVK